MIVPYWNGLILGSQRIYMDRSIAGIVRHPAGRKNDKWGGQRDSKAHLRAPSSKAI